MISPLASKLDPSKYPKLDTVPPVDSDEVKKWAAEVAATGIEIPDLSQTVDGWSFLFFSSASVYTSL
jgi:hypothetical protein